MIQFQIITHNDDIAHVIILTWEFSFRFQTNTTNNLILPLYGSLFIWQKSGSVQGFTLSYTSFIIQECKLLFLTLQNCYMKHPV